MGHPAASVAWLVNQLAELGEAVKPGQVDLLRWGHGPGPAGRRGQRHLLSSTVWVPSRCTVADGWIFVSALFGADPVDHAIPADVTAEGEQIFDNLVAILSAAGASLTDVVRVGIVMRGLQRDRPAFDKIWTRRFGEHRPARSAIQSAEFGRKGDVGSRPVGKGRGSSPERGWRFPTTNQLTIRTRAAPADPCRRNLRSQHQWPALSIRTRQTNTLKPRIVRDTNFAESHGRRSDL